MAGTVTTTEEHNTLGPTHGLIKKITFDWLSSAGGAADATTTYAVSGQLKRVLLVPDSGGTAPSDQYDVVISDADSYDLLHGLGANCSGTNTVVLSEPDLGQVAQDKLTLAVTNAGNAKGGIVIVYIQ